MDRIYGGACATAPVQQLAHEGAELALVVGRERAEHRQRLHGHALARRRQRVEQRRQQHGQVVEHLHRAEA